MLIGGCFLYMAYYGCDQSQAQRVLASRSVGDTQRVLLLNGALRFPIVLLYCLLGLALAAYAVMQPEFVAGLPLNSQDQPNFNLVYPSYVLSTFPPGVVGLVIVGIFAAAMSSIDSSLNALSAATVEDYVRPTGRFSERGLFLASKVATFAWGLCAVLFSYQVERIAPTVLEAINKIGSMANGPLLALFTMALLIPGVSQRVAAAGFACGLLVNLALWAFAPGVSWLWWNVAGWAVAIAVPIAARGGRALERPTVSPSRGAAVALLAMALSIFLICLWFGSAS
jgi:SSS family solute:Na+ symporter